TAAMAEPDTMAATVATAAVAVTAAKGEMLLYSKRLVKDLPEQRAVTVAEAVPVQSVKPMQEKAIERAKRRICAL
ncbi:MAG: hypothetical protein OSJ64_06965, partial [Firmicutes bacterium]|nr:hypothetical protein [Bacillota bacterium]